MNAGDLDREFTLQQPSTTTDDGTYEAVDTVWGGIRLAGGNEVMRFVTPEATGRFVVTLRYRDDLRADMRLLETVTNRALQIDSYGDPDGRLEWLRVFCVEAQ